MFTKNITWFNPLYGSHVKTNLRKVFRKLIVKHFPKHIKWDEVFKNGPRPLKFFKGCLPQIFVGPFLNALSQISNKNTMKLSYSYIPNMTLHVMSTKHSNSLLTERKKPCKWIRYNNRKKCDTHTAFMRTRQNFQNTFGT